jgi:hypothetical protein
MAGVGSLGDLNALSAAPADKQILETTDVAVEITNDSQANPDGTPEMEYGAAIEAALPSEQPQEMAVETAIAVAEGNAAPAVPGASNSNPIDEVDLGYLALYEDLLPAVSKKPQTEKIALQPELTLVDSFPAQTLIRQPSWFRTVLRMCPYLMLQQSRVRQRVP